MNHRKERKKDALEIFGSTDFDAVVGLKRTSSGSPDYFQAEAVSNEYGDSLKGFSAIGKTRQEAINNLGKDMLNHVEYKKFNKRKDFTSEELDGFQNWKIRAIASSKSLERWKTRRMGTLKREILASQKQFDMFPATAWLLPEKTEPDPMAAYDEAQDNLESVLPTIKENPDKGYTSAPNMVLMNARSMDGGKAIKLAAPYDGTEEDALRVAKAIRLYASEDHNASMRQSETFGTDENGNLKYAFVQGEGQTLMVEAAQPESTLKKGKVGGMLRPGEVQLTTTGRKTSPFPSNIDTSTNRKATNAIRRIDRWLIKNAIDEAKARKDEFNLLQFENINLKNISQADKDGAEQYLFGDEIPPVLPSMTKPLVEKTAGTPEDFVPAPDGLLDFGEISEDIGKQIRRQPGKIRLQVGDRKEGKVHIEIRHKKEFEKVGYKSIEEFVAEVAENYTEIRGGRGATLILAKRNGSNKIAYIRLKPSSGGDFYAVKSATLAEDRYLNNKKLLWEGAPSLHSPKRTPNAISGQGSRDFTADARETSSASGKQNRFADEQQSKTGAEPPTAHGKSFKKTITPRDEEVKGTAKPEKPIEDFGEKIGGARKD